MPNLNLGGSKTGKAKGLANIGSAMERRQQERNGSMPVVPVAEKKASSNINKDQAKTSKLYEADYASIGPRTAKRYEKGSPPRLHLEYLEAINTAMNGQEEAEIVLAPINERLELSRSQAKKILTCLEKYGYLGLRRKAVGNGAGSGRNIIFRVLKKVN